METKYRNPYKVVPRQLDDLELDEAWIWCTITLTDNWSTDWDYWFNLYGYQYFCFYEDEDWSIWTFSNENDAILFKLMWG